MQQALPTPSASRSKGVRGSGQSRSGSTPGPLRCRISLQGEGAGKAEPVRCTGFLQAAGQPQPRGLRHSHALGQPSFLSLTA